MQTSLLVVLNDINLKITVQCTIASFVSDVKRFSDSNSPSLNST